MASGDFEFAIEQASTITGRGVAVSGHWRAGQLQSGDSAYLHVDGKGPLAVRRVSVEYARVEGAEEITLLLEDLSVDDVPVGAVLRSHP